MEPKRSSELVYGLLGERIRSLRKELRWTQADLAGRVGMARASVANIELGKQRVSLELLYTLAEVLGREPRDLLPTRSDLDSRRDAAPDVFKGLRPEERDWLRRLANLNDKEEDDEVSAKAARPSPSSRGARGGRR